MKYTKRCCVSGYTGVMAIRFYFIRHGRTVLNDAKIKQGAEGGLSKAGKAQADKLGAAFANLNHEKIRLICSSPYERAKETAEIIGTHVHSPVHYTPLLAERRNPAEVIGKPVHDPDVERIAGLIEKGFHEDTYRYSDEENFIDLKKRARACLAYLARNGKHSTCVVTHHAFLQVLFSYLLYREKLDAVSYAKLAFFNPADNAGVTICEYDPWLSWFSPTRGWKILAYNQIVKEDSV
jgi:broad specificity phosphatase PhoE